MQLPFTSVELTLIYSWFAFDSLHLYAVDISDKIICLILLLQAPGKNH